MVPVAVSTRTEAGIPRPRRMSQILATPWGPAAPDGRHRRRGYISPENEPYSHSMVAGGLPEMS